MARYVAFLRAINVGGRVVRMNVLRELFEDMGLKDVRTFIASGNVSFESASRNIKALEKKIEGRLGEALGYRVDAFVRSDTELAAVASYQPFPQKTLEAAGVTVYVGFVADPLSKAAEATLQSFRSETDEFHVHQREIYWLVRGRMSDSRVSLARMEKALAVRGTFRNSTTVRKIAVSYAPESTNASRRSESKKG